MLDPNNPATAHVKPLLDVISSKAMKFRRLITPMRYRRRISGSRTFRWLPFMSPRFKRLRQSAPA
jgi:hypothetical protein